MQADAAKPRDQRTLVRVTEPAVPPALFASARRGLQRVGTKATYRRTFWYAFEEPPVNVVEALVAALRPHLRPSSRPIRGVEWWIGRMRTTDVPLDFHHDRDLKLFEETGRLRHPVFSSVLFFNRVRGGALFVTDQRLRRRKGSLVLDPPSARDFATVSPRANRFASFPGDLLHGVLDACNHVPHGKLAGPPGPARLTLIFNWWDRRPRGVKEWSRARAYRELRS